MAKLRRYFNRPVVLKWVIAPYIGLLLAFGYTQHIGNEADRKISAEATTRAAQLCQVVGNVHSNAELRVQSDRDEAENSRKILELSDPSGPFSVILRERVRAAEQRVRVGEAGVKATALPSSCKPLIKERK